MNNFTTRTISGSIYVALVVATIILHPLAFGIFFLIVTVLSAREFYKKTTPSHDNENIITAASAILYSLLLSVSYGLLDPSILLLTIIIPPALFCFLLFNKEKSPAPVMGNMMLTLIYIVIPLGLLNFIPKPLLSNADSEPILLLSVFILVWINDTGAYLTGMALGRTKLFPAVSPAKTWEGLVGGIAFSFLASWVISLYSDILLTWQWLVMAAIISTVATLGDLTESLIKRSLQIKDFGTAIPGHGGMMDRIDSLLFASPAIFLYLYFMLR